MRNIRFAGALAAALAIGALAAMAPSAGAAVPEFGRCVKVEGKSGKYAGSTCIKQAAKGGSYEWTPLTSEDRYTFAGSGGGATLTAAGHLPISCTSTNISGEYTGAKTATIKLELQACLNAEGKDCTSLTNPQTKSLIETLPLEAELGFIKNEEVGTRHVVQTGLDIKPKSPLTDLVIYECGNPLETSRREGSVIGKLTPFDKMTTVSDLAVTARKGVQIPEMFEGGPKDTLSTTIMSGVSSETLATTLNIPGETGTNSTEVEIKAQGN
jgi:hypothetical protein